MSRNFLFLLLSILLFLFSVFAYGKLLRAKEPSLGEIFAERKIESMENPKIVVDISKNALELFNGDELLKRYKVNLGRSEFLLKPQRGNYSTTPVGVFSICNSYGSEKYFKVYKLNYPDSARIILACKKGFISEKEKEELLKLKRYGCNIKFGREIFGPELRIHGFGKANFLLANLPFTFNWTDGSIALSNEDLKELSPYLKIGMKVIIKE